MYGTLPAEKKVLKPAQLGQHNDSPHEKNDFSEIIFSPLLSKTGKKLFSFMVPGDLSHSSEKSKKWKKESCDLHVELFRCQGCEDGTWTFF